MTFAARRRLLRLLLSTLAAVWVHVALLTPARADTPIPPSGYAAIALSVVSPVIPGAVFIFGAKVYGDHYPPSGWEGAYIVSGVLGLGLGVTAVLLQSQDGLTCDAGCATFYGVAGAGIVLGGVMTGLGIAAAARGRPVARLVPVPLLIRTTGGPALGAGIAGLTF
jgi:hypothetical protein